MYEALYDFFLNFSIKGRNPQRVSTEIIIEKKLVEWHQIPSSKVIPCRAFPQGNDFLIENGHFRLKHKRKRRESSKSIEKHAHRKGNIKRVRTWSQAILSNLSKIAKDKCTHRSTNTFDASISKAVVGLRVHPSSVICYILQCYSENIFHLFLPLPTG